jgi:ribose transport system substrate-binding protein
MRLQMKRRQTVAVALALCVAMAAMAGCGSSGGSSSSSGGSTEGGSGESSTASTEAAAFKPEVQGGISGALLPSELELWKYNFSNGTYEAVPGNAEKPFVPELKQFPAGTKIGYIDPWAANPFSIPIREGFEELGKKYGFEVAYCDAAFKPEKAVECAEEISSQKPAFTVAGNWQAGAMPAMMKVFEEAKIPTDTIDVPGPNSVFVGTNNYEDGVSAGRAAGEFAKQEWSCEEVWLLGGENPAEGEVPELRLTGFEDGVQEICGEIPSSQRERVLMSAGTSDQALTVTTDWLTAHPQAKHVLGVSYDDERGSGMAKSFTQATETEAYAVGQGCDTVGQETIHQGTAEENHFLGCAAYFPEKYPEVLAGIALDVLEGVPVPNEAHIKGTFLTSANIDQYYPAK